VSRQPFERRVGERRSADRMDRRSEESRERRAAERRRGAGRRDLDTLLDVTRRLMTVTDLDALLRLIAEATVTMVGAERATIYHLDRERLETLKPDVILTQDLCDVCAVGTGEVRQLADSLSYPVEVVSLDPHTLQEVFESILRVGRLTGELQRGNSVVNDLVARLDQVRAAVRRQPVKRVITLEWLDPPFTGGHWVPEMVEIAGGTELLGRARGYSRECSWDDIVAARPDVVVVMPCGFGLERSMKELESTQLPDAWRDLPAVKNGEIYVVDGSSYFNRPGPRLVDGVEILASILHSEVWSGAPDRSFCRVWLSRLTAGHCATERHTDQ